MSSTQSISKHLADNILTLRKKKNLSQEQLSVLSDVPRSTLAHIESGSSNPSLQNLAKISMALQVGLEELLSPPRNEFLFLTEDQIPLQKRSQGRARMFKLIPDKIKGIEVDRMEIEAGVVMGGHPHLSGAKEYLTVLQGTIAVSVAGEVQMVPRGALFAFPGDQPHSYRNAGSSVAIAISIVIPVMHGMS